METNTITIENEHLNYSDNHKSSKYPFWNSQSKSTTFRRNNTYDSSGVKGQSFHTARNIENTQHQSSVASDWAYRYNRNGYIRKSILEEDSVLFAEHIQQMNQKNSFDFSNLESQQLKVLFNNSEIDFTCDHKAFSDLKLNSQVMENLLSMGFDLLTPVQRYIIPFVLEGKDSMGCAQTGSGKTIAFLAPIISLMCENGVPPEDSEMPLNMSFPVSLILVPTRELADQIYREARKIVHKTGITVVKVYGGVPIDIQIRELKYGCDVLVATPGRLIDHLERKLVSLSLVKYFVIDEADRMLDMGFEDQLREIVFCREMPEKKYRKNLMFSATIPSEVMKIANKFMNESYLITSSQDKDLSVSANANVEQTLIYADDNQKIQKLHEIFQQITGNAIVFMERKKSVDQLESFLTNRNYNVIAIHGDKPQNKRQEAIYKFSNGEVPILIATDVASRGLDFPNVSYVFNYDMPTNIDDYIHRIGRTGRCGNKGTAFSFINERNRPVIKDLYGILTKMKQEIPDWFQVMYKKCLSEGNGRSDYGYGLNRNFSDKAFSHWGRNFEVKKDEEYQKKKVVNETRSLFATGSSSSKANMTSMSKIIESNSGPPKPMFYNSNLAKANTDK